jgi:acetyltransferase-like isoleucine patch superfamily enzyme
LIEDTTIGNNSDIKHRLSIINGASIGSHTRILDQVNLFKCRIGDGCKIGPFVYIEPGVIIGNRVKIRSFVAIVEGVTIEDDVFIGPFVSFTNDKYPRIDNDGNWTLLRTVVQKGASIGSSSVIIGGITIGSNSLIGAGSVVTKDIPNDTLAFGNPAKIIRNIKSN